MAGSFRHSQWDPVLIITQIFAMQCTAYFSLGMVKVALDYISFDSRSLQHLFEYHEIHIRDTGGQMIITAFLINALLNAVALSFLVQRTKQCLDFSCTWHFIHLIVCWIYNGTFPTTMSWWLLNIGCAIVMCVCGEFLCLRTELREIPLLGPKSDL